MFGQFLQFGTNDQVQFGLVWILSAIISAKWAMDLGYGQLRQLIMALGALILGPLVPLVLYVRMLYKQQARHTRAGKII